MNITAIALIFASFVAAGIGALGLYTEGSRYNKNASNYFLLAILFVILAVVIEFFWPSY